MWRRAVSRGRCCVGHARLEPRASRRRDLAVDEDQRVERVIERREDRALTASESIAARCASYEDATIADVCLVAAAMRGGIVPVAMRDGAGGW